MIELHGNGDDWHQCFCVVVYVGGRVSSCRAAVLGSDQPFCGDCVGRHPAVHSGVIVRTRPLSLLRVPRQRTGSP